MSSMLDLALLRARLDGAALRWCTPVGGGGSLSIFGGFVVRGSACRTCTTPSLGVPITGAPTVSGSAVRWWSMKYSAGLGHSRGPSVFYLALQVRAAPHGADPPGREHDLIRPRTARGRAERWRRA